MVKKCEIILYVDFDSLKEASWGTERNTKNHRSLLSTATEKIKKNSFWDILVVFLIFSVKVLSKDLWFFALRSGPQGASFELLKATFGKKIQIFHHKEGPFGFRGGQNELVRIYIILKVNALQKQSARHSSTYLVYMASA